MDLVRCWASQTAFAAGVTGYFPLVSVLVPLGLRDSLEMSSPVRAEMRGSSRA